LNEIRIFLFDDPGREGRDRCFRAAILDYVRETGISLKNQVPRKTGEGKPRLLDEEDIHFSISHSGGLWACAVADQPVGLDLQCVEWERNLRGIARRYFHPEEQAFLAGTEYRKFFSVWAAKESFVKYSGTGIQSGLNRFSVVTDGKLADSVEGVELRHIPLEENFRLCLCAESIGEVTLFDRRGEENG